jgi:hypothetical protein
LLSLVSHPNPIPIMKKAPVFSIAATTGNGRFYLADERKTYLLVKQGHRDGTYSGILTTNRRLARRVDSMEIAEDIASAINKRLDREDKCPTWEVLRLQFMEPIQLR